MANSIYDSYLTINSCKYYCNQLASKLNLTTYDYFYDNRNHIKFSGDSDIKEFKVFKNYESWQVKFNLAKPATVKKLGLEEYISKYHKLEFHLTIKGFSFLYICKFSPAKNQNETYVEEPDHQMVMVLN